MEEHPDSEEGYLRILSFYSREGRLDRAEIWIKEGIDKGSEHNYGLYFLLGMLQDKTGKQDDANISYEKVIAQKPDYVLAINNLAWNLAEKGELRKALELASRGKKLAPNSPSVNDTYGWILHRSGDSEGALPHLRKAVKGVPGNKAVRTHLVEVLETVGREEEAAHQFEILNRSE